jgi:hypothetical protein
MLTVQRNILPPSSGLYPEFEPQGSAMKMDACSSKMSVSFNRITQCYNPEDGSLK